MRFRNICNAIHTQRLKLSAEHVERLHEIMDRSFPGNASNDESRFLLDKLDESFALAAPRIGSSEFPDLVKVQTGAGQHAPKGEATRFGMGDSAHSEMADYLRFLASEIDAKRIVVTRASYNTEVDREEFPYETLTLRFVRHLEAPNKE